MRRGDPAPPRPGDRRALPPQVHLEVEALAARGKLVEAVKLARQNTDMGLVEATDYVRGLRQS